MRAVVAAPGKAPRRRACSAAGAENALVALDVGRSAEFAVGADRQHSRRSTVVIRHQRPFAGLVEAQVARTRAFRRDRVHQPQPSAGALDLIRAHGAAGGALVRGRFICRIETRPGSVQRQARRIGRVFKHRALDERAGIRIHLEQVDAFAPARRALGPDWRTVCAGVGQNRPARRAYGISGRYGSRAREKLTARLSHEHRHNLPGLILPVLATFRADLSNSRNALASLSYAVGGTGNRLARARLRLSTFHCARIVRAALGDR